MKSSPSSIAIANRDFFKDMNLAVEPSQRPADVFINSPLENRTNLYVKRSVDIFVSSLAILFLLSWLIPVLALLIRLNSKGSVFFLQKRIKKGGRLFTCIKFRTMVENEEAHTLAAHANDNRVTTIGKFLRKHHIDELPQLLNVWWGDMSLIGPRPHMISDDIKFENMIEHYPLRYKVKPGITGMAQVLGYAGPVTDIENLKRRVEKDVYYIRYWSALLDAKIVCRTFLKMMAVK